MAELRTALIVHNHWLRREPFLNLVTFSSDGQVQLIADAVLTAGGVR
jgi:hypothetical protein